MNRSNKDMMRYELMDGKYVRKTPDDALESVMEGRLKMDLYLPPYGANQMNEIRDFTALEAGYRVGYHYSDKGMETFAVIKGSVEVVLNGKKFILTEGDILNVEAWCPYGMTFLEEGTVVREMCTDRNNKEYDLPEPATVADAAKEDIGEAAVSGKGLYEFSAEGINLILKVGRWQLGGYKEIWEMKLDKGYRIQYNDKAESEGLFIVNSGRFMVEVDGKEVPADAGDLIHIPVCTSYSLTALDEDCVIRDFNVSCHLFRLLEMIEAAQDYFPEKLGDKEYFDYLISANNAVKFEGFSKVSVE
jgi:quercetin dioxygenase-like cupin family protein